MKPFDRNAADRAAAEWVIRRDAGLSAAEQDEYFQWLAADPRHGEAMARQQQTWQEFSLLAQWKPEHSAEPNPDLLARHRSRLVRPVWWMALAAAAGLAVGLALWTPERAAAPSSEPVAAAPANPDGYQRRVLSDGSIVELNRGARVEVAFTATERRVRLIQGEASFTVAKDPARPFFVRAAGVDVRAVGTVFNVRLGEKQVEVLVTEGKVQVSDAARGVSLLAHDASGAVPVLAAGQKVVVAATPVTTVTPVAVSPDETARLLEWQPQMLDFNSTTLSEVIRAFNRHNSVQLVLADPELGSQPIVASFRSDNVEGFVRLLELNGGVRAERSGDTITLSRGR